MPVILHIDTSVATSSVCLSEGKKILGEIVSASPKEAASWLHVAIKNLLEQTGYNLSRIMAVAVSSGPGSYTGLRVGMATAKGLCYAASIPLISINTLQIMAASITVHHTDLLCPMIDARRMEVFTALYTNSLEEVMPSTALILDAESFTQWLNYSTICFFGNGSEKAVSLIKHPNARFVNTDSTARNMVELAKKKFDLAQFSDVAYTEPFYGKAFYVTGDKKIY